MEALHPAAKDREGKPIPLKAEGMYWSPIHGSEKTGTIELLVEVSEDKEPPEAPEGVPTTRWFQGRRFFYIVPIYRFGPGKPQRLPFEIHFWDEMKVHLDEKTQVLSMPHYYKPFPSQRAFRIGKEGILFHLSIDTALTNTLANPPEGHPEASPYLPTESTEKAIRTLIYQSPALNEVVVEPSRQP